MSEDSRFANFSSSGDFDTTGSIFPSLRGVFPVCEWPTPALGRRVTTFSVPPEADGLSSGVEGIGPDSSFGDWSLGSELDLMSADFFLNWESRNWAFDSSPLAGDTPTRLGALLWMP